MENRINIGELDTPVMLVEMEQTIGSQGQKSWSVVGRHSMLAHVERNVNEVVSDSNLESENSLNVTCYKLPGLTTRWRVEIACRSYEIVGIDPVSRTSPLNILSVRAING